MSPISVRILVPSWMKKYLISQSENKTEPLEFPRRHEYNMLLIRLVNNRSDILPDNVIYDEEELPTNIDETKYTETVNIRLPYNRYKNVYYYNKLCVHARKRIRAQVKEDMMYDFFISVKDKILSGTQRKIAIEVFFLKHNISEDDLNYESFYRKYTRYIKKKHINC